MFGNRNGKNVHRKSWLNYEKKEIDKWCRCIRGDIAFDNYTFTYSDATYGRKNVTPKNENENNDDTMGRLLEINNRKYQFDKRPARARIMNKEKKIIYLISYHNDVLFSGAIYISEPDQKSGRMVREPERDPATGPLALLSSVCRVINWIRSGAARPSPLFLRTRTPYLAPPIWYDRLNWVLSLARREIRV